MSTWSLHNQEILQIIVPRSENPTLEVIQKVGEYVQFEEEWNLLAENTTDKLKREVPISASSEPPKKKRWTEKADVTSMQRINISNTHLGWMRASGQLKQAPISKAFFEQAKREKKKKKKGMKSKKTEKNLTQLKFLVEK